MNDAQIVVVSHSPWEETNPPPWEYEVEGFTSWVHEVFLEGYKRDVPTPSLEDALSILRSFGYKVEVRNGQEE